MDGEAYPSPREDGGCKLARIGIQLALNNRVEEAQRLLRGGGGREDDEDDDYDDVDAVDQEEGRSLQAQAGLCFLAFMNAVMTFEEEKVLEALSTLRATQKRCEAWLANPTALTGMSNGSGMMSLSPSFSSLSRIMLQSLGLGVTSAKDEGLERQRKGGEMNEHSDARLEHQIVLADCLVLEAVLNFLHQEWTSYVKGGWVLRKAWKTYQKTYTNIWRTYVKEMGIGGASSIAPPLPSSESPLSSPEEDEAKSRPSRRSLSHSLSMPLGFFARGPTAASAAPGGSSSSGACSSSGSSRANSSTSVSSEDRGGVSQSSICRLMSAVSFGYGIFHLAVSLLPPKLLGIVHLLGFEGNRQAGIQALHFARQGQDMRGPIATLALLWFHTIVRPFFGLDGSNLKSGSDAAQRLIDSSRPEFQDSALFLFFQGRVDRLKWQKAAVAFTQLKRESRWSKSFYCYLSAVCVGASGETDTCLALATETPRLASANSAPPAATNSSKRKSGNHQLERFLQRRAARMAADCANVNAGVSAMESADYCLLLAYELLYLWNALGACLKHSSRAIRIDCERIRVPALEGVRQLILGSVYSNCGEQDKAEVAYGLAMKADDGQDTHAAAFAAYELGLLLCRKQETRSEGRRYLLLARDGHRHYDFEGRLNVRIHAALRYYSEDPRERLAQALISN